MDGLCGAKLGKYEIISRLGEGGMADIYLANQLDLERQVAVKVIHRHLAEKSGFLARFRREAAAAARLRHPNIIKIFDYDTQDGLPYIVMEWVEGCDLKSRLGAEAGLGRILPDEKILAVFGALSQALDYAHARGIVHRDLKPSNVMLTDYGQVILMDFGIALLVDADRITDVEALVGTPAYMSPEQCRGEKGDRRSDVYSLGVMLFEVYTGQLPFQADHPFAIVLKHLTVPAPQPSDINPDVSPAVEQVILKALSKTPEGRYQSAGELFAHLAQAVGEGMPDVHPVVLPSQGDTTIVEDSLPGETMPAHPFQALPEAGRFVGRKNTLREIRQAILAGSTAAVYALTGMGGIGKTALAVRLAHLLEADFPDGVLWANASVSSPLAIVDSWAQAYQCDFGHLPDLASRAAALRSLLAECRALLILDDVRSAEAVRQLLPGKGASVALLTTRDVELAVSLNARIYPLSPLKADESLLLLEAILGAERVRAEVDAAVEIGRLLGHLPLAVEIIAQRLSTRSRLRLETLAQRLKDESTRLNELRLSDREARASFSMSWNVLPPDLRRVFACLGVFDGRPVTPQALAATSNIPPNDAEENLYTLAALSLVSEEGQTCYRQHPLLASFAREMLGSETETVETRLVKYYLDWTVQRRAEFLGLEAEWEHLAAVLHIAHQRQMWVELSGLVTALEQFWFNRGFYTQARQMYPWAVEAARRLNDQSSLADCLRLWGQACWEQTDAAEALQHLTDSLDRYHALDQPVGIFKVKQYLARMALEQSQYDQADRLLDECMDIGRRLVAQFDLGGILWGKARVAYFRGDYALCNQYGCQALPVQEQQHDGLGMVKTLNLLASAAISQNDLALAEELACRNLAQAQQIQHKVEHAIALKTLADVYLWQNRFDLALEYAEQGLALLQTVGDRDALAYSLYSLLDIHKNLANFSQALAFGFKCLEICRDVPNRLLESYTLIAIGDVNYKQNYFHLAKEKWLEALDLAYAIAHPTAIEQACQRLEHISANLDANEN